MCSRLHTCLNRIRAGGISPSRSSPAVQKDAAERGECVPLWDVPEDVVRRIVRASAGDRLQWMAAPRAASAPDHESSEASDAAAQDEPDEWSPELGGLSLHQCLSSELLHSIVLPMVTSHPALLAPPRGARTDAA